MKSTLAMFAAAVLLALSPPPAAAMEFRLIHNPEDNIDVFVGEGRIVAGDVDRLRAVADKAGRDRYGNKVIYLDSPGGSVAAAFAMVEFMDEEDFTAIVGSEARCASACASIVYISARFHEVVGTGLLGIHTCYIKQPTGEAEPSSFCNDKIAKNAYAHGTSYAAVNMWQKAKGPGDMAWIGKEVACEYGLCGPPGFDDTLAIPSFDCKEAAMPSEIAICNDKRLARYEASLAKYYKEALAALPEDGRKKLRGEQRNWLKVRDSCADPGIDSCLLVYMKSRTNDLLDLISKQALEQVQQ